MNRPLTRILIVGAGSIGERHIRCFLATRRAEVVVCEPNAELLRTVRDRYAVAAAHTNLDDALNEADLDAALIATPAHTHIPLAQRCADRGLHLLIEKPLALSLDGIDAMARTLDDHGRIGAVAYVQRANPIFARVKGELETGRWGTPLQLTLNTGQHFPTFRPAYRDIYYKDRATGGGAILDALPHMLNLGEWLVGPISRVLADADHLALPGVDVEDTVHVIARHGRVMASYSLNQHQSPNETFLQIVCTGATVRVEPHASRITWTHAPGSPAEELRLDVPDRDSSFVAQAVNFLDAVRGDSRPLCSLAEGLQTQRVIDQVLASTADTPWFTVARPVNESIDGPRRRSLNLQ